MGSLDSLSSIPAEAFQSSLLHALAGSLCHFLLAFFCQNSFKILTFTTPPPMATSSLIICYICTNMTCLYQLVRDSSLISNPKIHASAMAMAFIFASKVQLSEVGRELQVDEKPTCLRMVGVGKVGWDG